MQTYIALFRGINVGGTGSLPMKELAALLQDLGCREVRTYIQSGNAVFASPEPDATRLAAAIGAEVKARRGFEPKVLLLSRAEFEQAAATNRYTEGESDPQAGRETSRQTIVQPAMIERPDWNPKANAAASYYFKSIMPYSSRAVFSMTRNGGEGVAGLRRDYVTKSEGKTAAR